MRGVGIFDVSHMGDIRIHTAKELGGRWCAVQHLAMNDASKLAIGQAQYSAMLYPNGTFVDDVVVHRLGEDDFLLVINAGTREKDMDWVRKNTAGFDCVVEELSDSYTQLAIQGPVAVDVLSKLTYLKPGCGQELLVYARNEARWAEGYVDCANRLHGRGWI